MEVRYYASTSGYTSDLYGTVGEYYFSSKNAWSTSTSTIIQGGVDLGDGTARFNYYGIMYFKVSATNNSDAFAAIRTKNITHYPTRIRLRMKSHYGATRTLYVHIGKGMAKDTFSASARPVNADGASVKTISCSANSWCELNTTDSTWLAALVDPDTTCFYINRYPSGYGDGFMSPWDTGSYWEGDGALHTNEYELYVNWEPRNTSPNPPSSISITSTGFGTGGNVGAVTSVDISCGAASDSEDAETALKYQFEYSVAGGAWTVLQSWVYDKSVTLNLSGITAGQLIQFRAAAKDTAGAISPYIYTSNRAYKIPAPSAPASIITPPTITSNNTTLSWTASSSYDTSVGVRYTVEFYDPKANSWYVVDSDLDSLTTDMNVYDVLSLDEENKQYYYQTSNQLRVKATFATAVQGQTLSSNYTTSNTFTTDLRINPEITSFSVNYSGTERGYEGVSYTVSINKGSVEGNKKDANGDIMQYRYKVDLLYGEDYTQTRNLATTSYYVWDSLPSSINITMPSNIITTSDISAKIRVSICNKEDGCTHPTDSSFTLKRYRNPVVNIKSFTRNSTDFSITFDITDTGLGSQTVSRITSATATFNGVPKSYIFASSLTNLVLTFNSGDGITGTSSGVVTLVVVNDAEDSMPDKSGSDTQSIPQFLPNLRVKEDGVYVKNALYVWDINAVPYKVALLNGTDNFKITKNDARFDINRPNGETGQYAALRFFDDNVFKGGLYWDYTNNKLKYVPDGINFYDIWHSGNFNPYNYLALTGGTLTGVLRLPDTADVSLTSTGHAFQIGQTNGYNIAMDGNEIQARNNGAASPLHLNYDGGSVYINGEPAFNSGSNENGSYIKFPDGTMICWMRITVTDQAINTAYGSSLYQGTRTWTFPATFVEPPTVHCSHFQWYTGASWGTVVGQPTADTVTLRGIDVMSRNTGQNCYISAIAIGKWK
jgi:hypothetical protein